MEAEAEVAAAVTAVVTTLLIEAKPRSALLSARLASPSLDDGQGRYLTHQKASQTPLSTNRFLIIYAATIKKRARDAKISSRSSKSDLSSAVTKVLEVLRRLPKTLYRSEVDCSVFEDSSAQTWCGVRHVHVGLG